MLEVREAIAKEHFIIAVDLFKEYASKIDVDLDFQNFNEEIDNLSLHYTRPNGVLCLAFSYDQMPVGCFGVRKLDDSTCELKRMYVRAEFRGAGVGKQLLFRSLEIARELGYQKIRLDTLPGMKAALNMYKQAGFYEIEPYRFNPVAGASYLEMDLNKIHLER